MLAFFVAPLPVYTHSKRVVKREGKAMARRGYSNYSRPTYQPEQFGFKIKYNGVNGGERTEILYGRDEAEARRHFEDYPNKGIISVQKIEKAKEEDTRTPLEKRTAEINGPALIGFKYMSGQINVKDVVTHINTRGNWGKTTEAEIARGAEIAEREGFAIKSRVQPVQGEITRPGPVRQKNWDNPMPKKFTYGKKLKKGDVLPEPYISPAILERRERAEQAKLAAAAAAAIPAKATKKKSAAPRREPGRAATGGTRGRALSKYDVTAIDKQRKPLKEKDATGSKRIRPTKGEIRGELGKKRQKFDIYNVSKHRHVKE